MGHFLKGEEGIGFYVLKLFLLLYGVVIISFADEKYNLQIRLNILKKYLKMGVEG